jgi:hypothetical protein
VLGVALAWPTWGCGRLSSYLGREMQVTLASSSVQRVLRRAGEQVKTHCRIGTPGSTVSTRWAARSVIRRPRSSDTIRVLCRKTAPGARSRAAFAPKPRHAVLEHAAHQELPELALDELRQARPVAGLRHRAQEVLQVFGYDLMVPVCSGAAKPEGTNAPEQRGTC